MCTPYGLYNYGKPPAPPVRLSLFCSHNWGHGYRRTDLHSLLGDQWIKGVDFSDFSIPSSHPIHDTDSEAELFDRLADIISSCDVFLVFAGMEASHSVWMEREVHIARTMHVPIIAVKPFGQERLSKVATTFAAEIVHWRGDSIRDAILRRVSLDKRTGLTEQIRRRQQSIALSALAGGLPYGGRSTVLTAGLGQPTPNALKRK